MAEDRFGNPHAPGLPYAHGEFIRDSRDDHAKLKNAWRFIDARARDKGLDEILNLSGLERGFTAPEGDLGPAHPPHPPNASAIPYAVGIFSRLHGII